MSPAPSPAAPERVPSQPELLAWARVLGAAARLCRDAGAGGAGTATIDGVRLAYAGGHVDFTAPYGTWRKDADSIIREVAYGYHVGLEAIRAGDTSEDTRAIVRALSP